jgi:hypothetical protein
LQAIRAGARKGARPPDSWDDVAFDRQCWLPQRIAAKMVERGWNPYDVIDRLVHRYGLPLMVARSVVEMEMYGWERNCPTGTAQVYRERRDGYGYDKERGEI